MRLIVHCVTLTLITSTMVLSDTLTDVIVVGAGLSGAAAARTLHNTNKFRVTILEARSDRLGGRIWTDRSIRHAQGPECELGSRWLQQPAVGSEFSKLLHRLELTTREIESIEFSTSHGPVVESSQRVYTFMQQQIIDAIKREISSRGSKSPISMYSLIQSMDPLILHNNLTVPWSTLAATFICPTFGTNLSELSVDDFQTGRMMKGVQILEGLDELVNRLIGGTHAESPIDVELGKVVRQVKVDNPAKKVKVRTVDQRSYTADAVIITLPLGVLKDGSVQFDPRLSPEKRAAIQSMGVGLVNTVIVEFSQTFWSPGTSVFIAAADDVHRLTFPVWIDGYTATNRPVLTSHTYGDGAEQLESLGDEQVKQLVLESLKSIFSAARVAQASMISLTRSAWKKDGFAAGSASYLPVGISLADRRELSRHISPRVYFAGEHTSLDKGGTVEGAYMSGVEAAETLIHDVQTQSHSPEL